MVLFSHVYFVCLQASQQKKNLEYSSGQLLL